MKKDEAPRKLRRNDPCHCGSGKKYKHCWQKDQDALAAAAMDRMGAELQHRLNPIENPEDDVLLRTRSSYNRQMNRGELLWAAIQESGGKALPNMPPEITTAPFEKTDAFSVPPDSKRKPRSKKKK